MAEPLAIACALGPVDLAVRCDELLPGVVASALGREDIEGGYRYKFAADSLPSIFHAIEEERHCCPFVRFEIVIEPGGGAVALSVTGPDGIRDFIDGLATLSA